MGDPNMNSTSTRGVILLGVIFVLGMACGASLFFLGQRSVSGGGDGRRHKPPKVERRGEDFRLNRMAEELDLDDSQREQIRGILEETREQVHASMEESRRDIRAVLRPDQQEIMDRKDQKRRSRSGRHRGPGGFGGPPPDGPPPEDP